MAVDLLHGHLGQVRLLAHPGTELRHHQGVGAQVREEVTVDRDTLDPKDARTDRELKEIQARLAAITMPSEYEIEWRQTDAGRRLAAWKEDAQTLRQTVREVFQAYEKAVRDGRQVLADADLPNLPSRAQRVLDENRNLPGPKNEQQKIPGSDRVTYAAVFEFENVQPLYHEWNEEKKGIKSRLELPASLRKP